MIFFKNLQNAYFSIFAIFYQQQTISLKNKNVLKSILVRRFFELFFMFLLYPYNYIFFLLKIPKH